VVERTHMGPMVVHVAAVEYTATKLLLPQLHDLRQRGFDARLACAPDGDAFDERLRKYHPKRMDFPRSVRPLPMMRATRDLVRFAREVQPEILHLHTPAAALPARMVPRGVFPATTRIVYTVHGFAHVWDEPTRRDRALEMVERRLAKRTDMLLFQSGEDWQQTRDRGYRTRLRYLGNGVEDSWFTIPPKAAPSRPLELLYVGRLIREKGLLDLFDALEQTSDVRLVLAGSQLPTDRDGVEDDLKARAAREPLDGRVTFAGMVEKDVLRDLVAEADFLVLPSYREGVPRSMIEGFATGTPGIATDVRGCRELVDDGVTGFLVPPREPSKLAEALRRAASLDDEAYRRMTRSAAGVANVNHRESAVFERLVSAYAELDVHPPDSASLGSAVVGDELRGFDSGSAAATEEEQRTGGIDGEPLGRQAVQQAKPAEEQTRDAPGRGGAEDRPDGVFNAP